MPTRSSLLLLARRLLVVAVALVAAGAALSAWGATRHAIGPLETRLGVVPALAGGVSVSVPPLGRLELPTHVGPLQLRATVVGVEPGRARRLLRSDNPGQMITRQVTEDSERAVGVALARGLLVALGASAVTCAVVFRRRRAVIGGTAAVAVALVLSGGVAAGTLRPQALAEPRFDGLLEQAPALIGRVQDFDAYSQRVAELTANVARVYGSLATLPTQPDANDTRVLWVSDIHNNPEAFIVMAELIEQFDVAAVVDTGDLVDLGSAVENRQLTRIGGLRTPYLYVRGNHDSAATQAAVARQPNAQVLDDGEVTEVNGVRFAGIGDPLFTPTKRVKTDSEANNGKLRGAGQRLADAIAAASEPIDVALVHEPTMAEPLFGAVPLVLDGHVHERRSRVGAGTLELTQGSSGGAGLRTLDEGRPLPLQMSVLHFDSDGALIAVDDITVGGLGERSVTVERRTPSSYGEQEPASEPS